jgi:flagellar hook-associated protein 1
MSTISGIMTGALSALQAYTTALDVVGTNIANVETAGYTRRSVVLQEDAAIGVSVSDVKRIYSSFLTERLRAANQDLGAWEAAYEIMPSVEAVFTASGDYGLGSVLDEFWSSWQDVVNDPADATARSVLAACAANLADGFNGVFADLAGMQEGIDRSLAGTAAQINTLVGHIADVNRVMAQATTAGGDINTYKDTLDSLEMELSALIDIDSYTNDAGQLCVRTGSGRSLVEGTMTWSLSTRTNVETGLADVVWGDGSGPDAAITGEIAGGKLAGYLQVRDVPISSYRDSLDELAAKIIAQVNSLHAGGYDLYGEAGSTFFTGTGAADMAIEAAIAADAGKIAAAGSAGNAGDGTVASAIANLQNSLLMNGGTSTLAGFYTGLISAIGAAVGAADRNLAAAENALNFCQSQRDSLSAVSTDEELVKLTLYQQAYEAAAKVMTAMDEIMQATLDM